MTGKTHMFIGVTTALVLSPKLGIRPDAELIAGAVLGSLILDLDHPKAKLNQKILPIKNGFFKTIFYTGLGFFLLRKGYANTTLLKMLSGFFIMAGISSHRSFTHSLLGLGFIGGMCYLLASKFAYMQGFAVGIIIGAILHLVADMFTNNGVELFYPFKRTRIKMPYTIKTDSLQELLILMVFMASLYYVVL